MVHVNGRNIVLRNGKEMPLLGLGCWQSKKGEVEKAVEIALDAGYRHIDTATMYENEVEVGQGIKNWLKKDPKNKREDLFIVTKLPMVGMSPERVDKFIKLSLQKLDLEYLDLYLIHSPLGMKYIDDDNLWPKSDDGQVLLDYTTDLIQIWKALEKWVDAGKAKSIGVSNFNLRQLRKINAIARIPPVTNQVEMHVYFQQQELQEYCKQNDMVITAYGNLGSPSRAAFDGALGIPPRVLDDPVVKMVAENHRVTPAQVLLRYIMQLDVVVIPKSVTPSRIKTNGDIFSFKLMSLEMEALKSLDKGIDGKTFVFAHIFQGSELHPEMPEF